MNYIERLKYRVFFRSFVSILRGPSIKQLSKPPFFILGSGRNGSTLLASILNAHDDIFIPPEQFVLPYAIMKRYIYFLQSKDNWKESVMSALMQENKTLNWDFKKDNILLENKSVGDLFNCIYVNYASQKNKSISIWGDKTPLNTHFIDFIYPEFKTAKYIFMVRDPRDVVLSYKQLLNHKAVDTRYALWKWKDSIRMLDFLEKRTDVLVLRYEDIVSQPQKYIELVLSYLDMSNTEDLIQYKAQASNMGVADKPHHQNLNQPINSRSVGKWKEGLSSNDIDLINSTCSKYLERFRYA